MSLGLPSGVLLSCSKFYPLVKLLGTTASFRLLFPILSGGGSPAAALWPGVIAFSQLLTGIGVPAAAATAAIAFVLEVIDLLFEQSFGPKRTKFHIHEIVRTPGMFSGGMPRIP